VESSWAISHVSMELQSITSETVFVPIIRVNDDVSIIEMKSTLLAALYLKGNIKIHKAAPK
jgi:hypothetical protein